MDIDLKAVIQFAHLARTRSFSRTAAELGVPQPWLSSRIRRLEDHLGHKLFLRTTRPIEMTREGELLLASAELLAGSAAAFEREAAELSRDVGRRIRIGSPPYAGQVRRRVELIEQFASANRAIVELDLGWNRYLVDHLRRGDLDAAFLLDSAETQDFERMPFCTLRPVVVARPSDPLVGRGTIGPGDLAGRDIGVFVRSLNPGVFDQLFTPLQQARVRVVELPEINHAALVAGRAGSPSLLFRLDADPMVPSEPLTALSRLRLSGVPDVELLLTRRRGPHSAVCERFWLMARSFSEAAPG